MLVQAVKRVELAIAEVALIAIAIPSPVCGLVLFGAGPSNEFLGNHSTRILLSDESVDRVTVKMRGLRARPVLKVMRETGCRRVSLVAEGTVDGLAKMSTRSHMLRFGQCCFPGRGSVIIPS